MIRIFCSDLGLPEAPVLLDDGSWLVTELDLERGCITHIAPDGASRRQVRRTGRPNGLAVDRDGAIWVAESLAPAGVISIGMDGEERCHFHEVDGRQMLWCNDICIGPDGYLYVTDSGTDVREFLPGGSIRPDYAEIEYRGAVYRIDPTTGDGSIVDDGIRFANGVAFASNGDLYANETMTGDIFRYRAIQEGRFGERELFTNVLDPTFRGEGLRGPDGMAFSEDGRLWVAVFGQGDVTVIGDDGTAVDRMKTQGGAPTNVAFGPRGSRELYCVEDELGQIEVLDVDAEGLRLHR